MHYLPANYTCGAMSQKGPSRVWTNDTYPVFGICRVLSQYSHNQPTRRMMSHIHSTVLLDLDYLQLEHVKVNLH